uniref:CYRIA/CYRIB Rac1 binding domain-containing protein n=1 Tax=Trichogramma kaykai TaxID=54128 RepID=A0ABD2XAI6_9HYME
MYSWFPEDIHVKDNIELLDALECAIIKGTDDWFEYYMLSSNVIKDTDDMNRCIDIIHNVEIDLQKARDQYENIFIELGQILCSDQTMEHMQIHDYHDWFEPGVIFWLSMTSAKARSVIDRAIEFDKFQAVDSSVRYTSSAMDLLTIFHEIKDFWLKLAWPEGEKTYKILMKIVDDICRCSLVYVDRIAAKFSEDCTDFMTSTLVNLLTKSFYVSSNWCYSVNNIYYIKTSIESLFVNDLQVEKVFQTIDRTMSPVNAKQSERKLRSLMDETRGTMDNLIATMQSSVVTNMTPTMARLLKDGTEQFDSNKPFMEKLMEYLEQNLHTLHEHLNEEAFQKCLQLLWGMMFELFHRLTEDSLKEKRTPNFYTNLHQTLLVLIRFFRLGKEDQDYRIIAKIENLLKLYGSDSSELIYNYYKDRLQQQNNQNHEFFGVLTVKAYFLYDKLHLQILNARNLKSVDTIHPYLIRCFTTCSRTNGPKSLPNRPRRISQPSAAWPTLVAISFIVQTTKISPAVLVLTPEQKKYPDGLIAFEILIREYFKSKFLAECFLSLSDIPEINDSSEIAAGIATLKQVHLKLSRPTDLNHRVLSILSNRKGDSSAANFATKEATRINAKLNYT